MMRPDGVRHQFYLVFPAQIARIDADFIRSVLRRAHGEARVKVDIRHHGNMDRLPDGGDRIGIPLCRDGDAHDVASRPLERQNFRDRAVDVGGGKRSHGLHGNGRSPAHAHAADDNRTRIFFINHIFILA